MMFRYSDGIMLTIAWGTFAFGGVYPSGYVPVIVASVILGLHGLFPRGSSFGIRHHRALAIALAVVALTMLIQLIPLPASAIAAISPATDEFLRRFSLVYSSGELRGVTEWHPLSISPKATRFALTLVVSFSLLMLGTARMLGRSGAKPLVQRLIIIGGLLAFLGLVQKVTWSGKFYGIWPSKYENPPFGPFVNRNSFAGWMMMGLPLTMGYVFAMLPQTRRGGWRNKFLWLSTTEAGQFLVVVMVSLLMAMSLVMTMSRSGIGGFAIAMAVAGVFLGLRKAQGLRRGLALTLPLAFFLVVIGWTGLEPVVARFASLQGSELGGRLTAWRNALDILQDFFLVGTGINGFATAMLYYQSPELTSYYDEAHNDYLQLASEGGLLVGIPILAALFFFVREIHRRFVEKMDDPTTYWLRVGAVIGLFAIALQETVEFSLQIVGDSALFSVLGAIAIHKPPSRRQERTQRQTRREHSRRTHERSSSPEPQLVH